MKRVRLIGLVTSVRQVQTKTGKMMAIATCDSFDFKFTVLVFSKEYEALGPLLEEDKILLVEGIFRGNEENGEMAVTAQTIRPSTITSIRQQAKDMNLFDSKALVNLSGFTEEIAEANSGEMEKKKETETQEASKEMFIEPEIESDESEDEESVGADPSVRPEDNPEEIASSLQEKSPLTPLTKGGDDEGVGGIEKHIIITKYIIQVPSSACRQDLVDLKSYLE